MPRPRVKDADRKRVARACDTCKRRKEKCDGGQPCVLCRRRARDDQCRYSDGKRGSLSLRRGSVESQFAGEIEVGTGNGSKDGDGDGDGEVGGRRTGTGEGLGEGTSTSNDAEIAIESLLTLSGNRSAARTPQGAGVQSPVGNGAGTGNGNTPQVSTSSHAPVPKLARLLRDGHGKFIFVGDSSTLAFLQNVRRIVKTAIGECALTTDPKRHAMIEAIPSESLSGGGVESHVRARPTRVEAQEFIQSYLLATSGIIDLFDQADILQHLLNWTEDVNSGSSSTSSIFYLVLAIGALNRATENEEQAAFYFKRGRELAVSSFMDDPSVLTVQSYILIAFYMLSSCRRNGAFMLLGIAIRAAYALGLHRTDISVLFEIRERRTRERVWKSLRVLDMFLSASLGRPPATSEVDGGNVSWEGTSRGYEDINLQALHSSAMLRICFIFERVLNEVYCRREVSVQLVDNISRQYRDWNLHLDSGLQNDGLSETETESMTELQKKLGVAHLKGAYYWSIILLTRPFLIFDVSSKLRDSQDQDDHSKSTETVTLSEACIDAALRSVEIATEIIPMMDVPKRPIFVTNSVFVSSLVIGLAMLGDYDRSFPLLSSMGQVRLILAELAKYDPAARRFAMIAGYLQQAALEHIKRRDERQLIRRRQGIQSIFGTLTNQNSVIAPSEQVANGATPTKAATKAQIGSTMQLEPQETTWPRRPDEDIAWKDMTITTSGVLATSARDSESQSRGPEELFTSIESGLESNLPVQPVIDKETVRSYGDEFPLFSLMNEVDSMSDPFFMEFA